MDKQEKFIQKNKHLIDTLRSLDLDFNDLFILECFINKGEREFFEMFKIPSMKDFNISTRFQFLKKNEYLVEDPNDTSRFIISVKGADLIFELHNPTIAGPVETFTGVFTNRITLSKSEEECFEEWWKAYPTNPGWTSDDKKTKFTGSRVLKNLRKDVAKKRYLKLLNQGLKHEDLLGSLKYEVKMKKLDSVKKNANQMEFFKGMESYMNQERYLLFIDAFRADPDFVKDEGKVKGKTANVKDI